MSDLQGLTNRIDAEIDGFKQTVVEFQDTAKSAYEAREARFNELFVPAANRVVELIRPRLQVLIERFKDSVDIKPVVTEHLREVEMKFNSPVAQIDLAFSLTHDMDVKNLILDRRLNILPIFMKFDEHSDSRCRWTGLTRKRLPHGSMIALSVLCRPSRNCTRTTITRKAIW